MVRLLTLVLVLAAAGCSSLSPASFWATYRPELIEAKYSDQGPWGGVRWVHWASRAPAVFQAKDVIAFATSHGWQCEDPVVVRSKQLLEWQYAGRPVFPLHFGAADQPPDNVKVQELPRTIMGDSLITRCKSGWTRVEPGTAKVSDAFGYIQFELSGSRLAVYHLWGEI